MNTSFDDQASQSTTTDQQSEASSVNPQSPRSFISAGYILANNGNPNQTIPQNSLLLQQGYLPQESYMYANSSSGHNHHPNDVRNLHPHRAAAASTNLNPANIRRCYTGVDKLIMAAMMEESASAMAAASGATGYIPSGRGIGYSSHNSYSPQQIYPTPGNKSELELYRLLERANLLNYFGTFLNFGGDDVQQLSDADEDEFLEIMSLVGMTQKPLHVRRLQKALIEWRENREAEINNFRRPSSQPVNLGIHNIPINHANNHGHHQPSPSMTSASDTNNIGQKQQQQPHHYAPVPHEILLGAPKRLRLMDDLHKRSPINLANQHKDQEDDNCSMQHSLSNNNSCTTTITTKNRSPNDATENNSFEQLPLSPRSQKSSDMDDDKLIEVMNSPQTDLELEDDNNRRPIDSNSPDSARFSYNKYGRYKASLRGSPNKVKP